MTGSVGGSREVWGAEVEDVRGKIDVATSLRAYFLVGLPRSQNEGSSSCKIKV